METILSARLKNIIFCCLAGIFAAGAFFLGVFHSRSLSSARIAALVKESSDRVEAILAVEVKKNISRSELLFDKFKAGRLTAAAMLKKEALIQEKNGIIVGYIGEIYFFKSVLLRSGEWILLKKNQDLYFFRRLDQKSFYLHFFMAMKSKLVKQALRYPYSVYDLKYANSPLAPRANVFSYDRVQKRFFFSHVLAHSQKQLVLNLVFSQIDIGKYFSKSNKLLFDALIFCAFLALFLAFAERRPVAAGIRILALSGMAFAAWSFIAWLGRQNIYFPRSPLPVQSVYQLLVVLLFVLLFYFLFNRNWPFQNNLLALFFFNSLALADFFLIDRVLRNVNFPFGDFAFNLDFLGLLALLSGLHLLPLLAAGHFAKPLSFRRTWPIVLAQIVLLASCFKWLACAQFSFSLLTLIFVLLLFSRRRFWLRILALLVIALAVSHWLAYYSHQEKQEFISDNLKMIFSSQSHYAKLVAREIVYEMNSRKGQFFELFNRGNNGELEAMWKNTLAAREAIASGIYVVSKEGELLNHYSYQIPYIDFKKENIFPFWHVEEVAADLFGKKISLAVATLNVFQGERYRGYIMVQVLNSAELLLKSQGSESIFTRDEKIKGAGLGYIKIDENLGILENPANINIENLAALMKLSDAWVTFQAMEITYSGYVFQSGGQTIIIYFPQNTFFKSFSEFIKIFVLLLLLAAPYYFRQLKKFQWRFVFQSFSVKVFVILVLLSLLTAAVFSVFSLNFNFLSLATQLNQAIYERGRSAANIINNLLAESGEINQNHLYLLEKILENDICVYENGILLYTSNDRKIIQSQLPIYLDSGIRDALQQNSKQFQLQKKENFLDLYFQTAGNYIFTIEFSYNTADLIRARQYYIDFIVSVFFILIVTGLAAAFFFRNKILAPIHRLNRGMAEVQQGNLQPLTDIPAEIELRDMYQGFNSMLEGIKEQKKNISEISKMKTLVQLGRRVAHEVKNPLTPIKLSAEQILRSLHDQGSDPKPVITSAVRYIIEETEHLQRVAYGFLNLSKLDELQAEPFMVNELIAQEISHLRPIYPHILFAWQEPAADIAVVADRLKIKQVIANVLNNALEAIGAAAGKIELALSSEGQNAVIRISDNGVGISGEELEMILSENFSSKDLGTGLGLVIARRFLELHRGGLEIVSRPHEGTTIWMRFEKNVKQT